ncbi:MAG: DUF411 domain-containing protein [Methylococcaceae bacterium]|nr:DUF411 domain-containing protein [Methylococcaceae bacterium]
MNIHPMERIVLKKTFLLLTIVMQSACAENSAWDKPTAALAEPTGMTVYRSPSCGCCGQWVTHMQKQGFTIKEIQSEQMDAIKQKLGVPKALQSCHTASVKGYTVEGHVPAADVKKLLLTQPKATGLAAPGMPTGSPGMEMGGRKDKFSVLIFDPQGHTERFAEHSDY